MKDTSTCQNCLKIVQVLRAIQYGGLFIVGRIAALCALKHSTAYKDRQTRQVRQVTVFWLNSKILSLRHQKVSIPVPLEM